MNLNDYKPGHIRTFTGKTIDILNIKENDICIEDIAHSLSMQCRFQGHTNIHYSVASHSLYVSDYIDMLCTLHKSKMKKFNYKQIILTGLLHDASEAYIIDLPSPIKTLMPQYKKIENNIMKVISKKYDIIHPLPYPVKFADKKALEHEWHFFVINSLCAEYKTQDVENMFIEKFNFLR